MIAKEDILGLTGKGLDIFRHYISSDFKIGKNFRNPLYADKKPSCNVYFDKKANAISLKISGIMTIPETVSFLLASLKA